jgi:hypothetical protein
MLSIPESVLLRVHARLTQRPQEDDATYREPRVIRLRELGLTGKPRKKIRVAAERSTADGNLPTAVEHGAKA